MPAAPQKKFTTDEPIRRDFPKLLGEADFQVLLHHEPYARKAGDATDLGGTAGFGLCACGRQRAVTLDQKNPD